jgi:hypothetical protein
MGTSGGAAANALTTGLDGSIYASGYTNGALDGQFNSGSTDALLTKYTTYGTKAWTKLPPRARDFRFGSFSKTGVFGQALNNKVFVSRADNLDALASWNCGTQKTIQRLSL